MNRQFPASSLPVPRRPQAVADFSRTAAGCEDRPT
jgi:hypothetical protein